MIQGDEANVLEEQYMEDLGDMIVIDEKTTGDYDKIQRTVSRLNDHTKKSARGVDRLLSNFVLS